MDSDKARNNHFPKSRRPQRALQRRSATAMDCWPTDCRNWNRRSLVVKKNARTATIALVAAVQKENHNEL